MILYATNLDRTKTVVIDTYSSLDWEPHYNEEGNFELHIQKKYADKIDFGMILENSDDLTFQGFVTCKEYDTSDGIESDVVIKGHFFIYKLYYRIVETIEEEDKEFGTVIETLLTPFQSGDRSLGKPINIIYSDESIKTMKVDIKADNVPLMNVILELCQQLDLGVNFVLNDDTSFSLQFYLGEDKTDEVIISLDLDTALEVNYYKDIETTGNYFYVKGNGYADGTTEILNLLQVIIRELIGMRYL